MDGLLRSLIKTVRRRLKADEEVSVEAVTRELGYTRQYISDVFTASREGFSATS